MRKETMKTKANKGEAKCARSVSAKPRAEAKPRKVTIEVGAEEYATLSRYAKALNKVAWTGGDNTVATLIENFCLVLDAKSVAESIVNGIDTGCSVISKAYARRRDTVEKALAEA